MKHGFVLPGSNPRENVELAVLAEKSGWDGIFIWEAAYHPDAWSLLAAMAMETEKIKLGTMLTPLPWRQPWNVAAQAATVDKLSKGRVILTVGLGAVETGRAHAKHPTARKVRAELLDEGLDVIQGLWKGDLTYEGKHYKLRFEPRPPRTLRPHSKAGIPIWVVGAWPRFKSMRRALRCNGVLPVVMDPDYRTSEPDDYVEIMKWLSKHKHPEPFDIVMETETPVKDAKAARAEAKRWKDVGCTWLNESRWMRPKETRARIEAGPPK